MKAAPPSEGLVARAGSKSGESLGSKASAASTRALPAPAASSREAHSSAWLKERSPAEQVRLGAWQPSSKRDLGGGGVVNRADEIHRAAELVAALE